MNYPVNRDDAWRFVSQQQSILDELDKQLLMMEVRRKNAQVAREVFKGVLEGSWKDRDPGKYRATYFFVDEQYHRVVVREYLSEGTKVCATRDEWKAYCATVIGDAPYYDCVPFHYQVVSLSSVLRYECPNCRKQWPVIERYSQIEDSVDYDEWMKEHIVLCLGCNLATRVKVQTSPNRF